MLLCNEFPFKMMWLGCRYYASYLAISVYAFTGGTGFNHEDHERHYPWFWYALLMMVHYFQRDAGKTVLESILKGAPGLYKTGKVSSNSSGCLGYDLWGCRSAWW